MSFNRAQFLIEILGADAAHALAKAASRSEYLSQMVVPRTILAMLEAVPAYEGSVPGFDDCSLSYAKSETGFTGNVTLGEDLYKFESASIFHVAGALSTAMGLDTLMFNNGRNTELQRLGKSIDLMAKAHWVLEKAAQPAHLPKDCAWCEKHTPATHYDPKYLDGYKPRLGIARPTSDTACEAHKHLIGDHAEPIVKDELAKKAMGEGSGKTAGPVAPAAPQAPTATAAASTTQQKLPKNPASAGLPKPPKPVTSSTVKLTRSESNSRCPVCSQPQFDRGAFAGCLCFRALAKSVTVSGHDEDHVEISFGEDWDRETVVTFLEAVGRGRK